MLKWFGFLLNKIIFFSFPSGVQDICWIICANVAFMRWSKNTSANTVCAVRPSLAVCSYDALKGIESSQRVVFEDGSSTVAWEITIFKWAYSKANWKKMQIQRSSINWRVFTTRLDLTCYVDLKWVRCLLQGRKDECCCFPVMCHVMLKHICFCRAVTSVWKNSF